MHLRLERIKKQSRVTRWIGMLTTFSKALRMIILKPGILIPGILSGIVAAIVYAIIYLLAGDITEYLLYGNFSFPPTSLSEFGAFLTDPSVLIVVFTAIILGFVELIFTIATFDYVRKLKQSGKAEILPSIQYGFQKMGDAFILTILATIVGIGALVVFATLNGLIENIGSIAAILQGIFVLIAAYIIVRLMFTVSVLSMDGVPVKQALQKSWKFTGEHFFASIGLGVILILISGIIDALIYSVTSGLSEEMQLISMPFEVIVGVFMIVSIAIFYYEKK